MEIIYRPIRHDPMEIIMGQFIWFHPVANMDTISVTANPDGFTTQSRVGQLLGYDQEVMVMQPKYAMTNMKLRFLTKVPPLCC